MSSRPSEPPTSDDEVIAPMFSPGTLLEGKYEVRSVLGHGAMGQVLEAYDTELGRRVAVKAHWPHIPLSIKHEARALAAIRHPGVVSVHAIGRHEDREFVVMEFVAGTPWHSHLERMRSAGTPAPVSESLDVLRRVASALATVHGAGLAHGDVKPGNVLLSPSRVTLTDLGLVRIEAQPERLKNLVLGTPPYVAPELVLGEVAHGNGHLVDVYAFGVMTFYALSGKFPFDAETAIELYALHVEAPIPSLIEHADVPATVSKLVTEMLAKDPHDRPASMETVEWRLQGALQQVTSDVPVEVLIVEDDTEIARMLRLSVLEGCPGARVAIAEGGPAALESFRARRPQLMLLDMMMPGMTGLELQAYLRGTGLLGDCAVVVVSAAVRDEDLFLLQELGARAFVPKGAGLRARVRDIARAFAREIRTQRPSRLSGGI